MHELWNPQGDCLVYLFPPNSGKGPSFRVDSTIFAASPALTKKAFGHLYSDPSIPDDDDLSARAASMSFHTPPETPQQRRVFSQQSQSSRSTASSLEDLHREIHLYMYDDLSDRLTGSKSPRSPSGLSDSVETLIAVRNFFAFLEGQSLVATERRSSVFSIFIRVAELLKLYEFSNLDSSTYGEIATVSFDHYILELGLDDVRSSREKTIEAIVLSERMRSVSLYNEAFTHCVGKHEDILKLNSSKFRMLSPVTVNRLGRAALELDKRTASVQHTLVDFEFPSIFAGIMNSKTADERKVVDFDSWREAFFSTRKFVLNYYKQRFGSWPPKASSKKNDLETSGLNRLVLCELFNDMSTLYDLLVDRQELTNRTADGVLIDERDIDTPAVRALRHILSEYDRSSPPVIPPIPFDLPKYPTLKSTRPELDTGNPQKDARASAQKLKDDEITLILTASYNHDTLRDSTSRRSAFIEAFQHFDRKSAHSSTIQEISDLRTGTWIFLYAVLQALPMLVVDAPGIKHSRGVEYFLCSPPRSGVPWANADAPRHAKNWYGIAGGAGGVVSLPSDIIEHGTDGVYHRSHCWVAAEKWSMSTSAAAVQNGQGKVGRGNVDVRTSNAPLTPPIMPSARTDSRDSSPIGRSNPLRSKRESVYMLGLEALSLPAGVHPDGLAAGVGSPRRPGTPGKDSAPGSPMLGHSRQPVTHHDPSKTFDAILANTPQVQGKAGRKKR